METMAALNFASACFAFAAAVAWGGSAIVQAKRVEGPNANTSGPTMDGSVLNNGRPIFKTMQLQSQWNRAGAAFACVAAALQGVVASI